MYLLANVSRRCEKSDLATSAAHFKSLRNLALPSRKQTTPCYQAHTGSLFAFQTNSALQWAQFQLTNLCRWQPECHYLPLREAEANNCFLLKHEEVNKVLRETTQGQTSEWIMWYCSSQYFIIKISRPLFILHNF